MLLLRGMNGFIHHGNIQSLGIYTEENLGVSLSLQVLFRFLGGKPFSQFFPCSFFHVFHLFENVCKRRREREMGKEEEKQKSKSMKSPFLSPLPYIYLPFFTSHLNEFLFQDLRQVCFPFQSIVQGVPYH